MGVNEYMKKLDLTVEERATVIAFHEAHVALTDLVNMSISNMDKVELEICLDTILPMLKDGMLKEWEFLQELKKKYKAHTLCYCNKDGEIYGGI